MPDSYHVVGWADIFFTKIIIVSSFPTKQCGLLEKSCVFLQLIRGNPFFGCYPFQKNCIILDMQQSKWTEYYPQIAVGDDVFVYGRVVNYHGTTPEFADRKCYVIPLPVPQYGK